MDHWRSSLWDQVGELRQRDLPLGAELKAGTINGKFLDLGEEAEDVNQPHSVGVGVMDDIILRVVVTSRTIIK